MENLLQLLINGIAAGSFYALIALAMVLIYRASEVVNFAQGEIALITAYFSYMLLDQMGVGYIKAFSLSLLFAFVVGCLIEFCVLRRAKEPNLLSLIIITIGIEMIIMGIVSWKFGADPKTMSFPISPYESLKVGAFYIRGIELLAMGILAVVILVMYAFLNYSKFGIAMRATQQNNTVARIMGIRVKRVLMVTWGISALTGSLAGLLIAPTTMQPYMMWDPMMKGFAGAVLGGMTSMGGAVIGSFIVGTIENLFGSYVSIEFKSAVAFLIIVISLFVRPSGLFARHYVKKV
ncbi:MAG: branched-chain amino acid ABC transporter permease [Desulfatiglandales bacterium]